MISAKEERELIRKAQLGDTESFAEIEENNRSKIKGAILNYSIGNDDPEETYQMTLIKAWKKIKKFKNNSSFSTWAIRIGINLIKDKYRSTKYKKTVYLESLGSAQENEFKETFENNFLDLSGRRFHSENIGLKNIEMREVGARIKKVFSLMPKQQKEILFLYAEKEMDYKEISKRLKIPIGTVMSRLFYARKCAKKILEKMNSKD